MATRPVGDRTVRSDDAEEDLAPLPWHLKFLASGIAIYLAYRLYQGIAWVIG